MKQFRNVGTNRISVRQATHLDATAILRNHEITLKEHIERERDFTETTLFAEKYLAHMKTLGARLRNMISHNRDIVLVADVDGVPAAHLIYRRQRKWLHPFMALVIDISVAPGHRRKGLACALIERMELSESRNGTPMCLATIWSNNSGSQAFFESVGYNIRQTLAAEDMNCCWLARKENTFTAAGYAMIWARTIAMFSPLFFLPPLIRAIFG